MKYSIICLLIAVSYVQTIAGESNFIERELDKLRRDAERTLERITEPVLREGQKFIEQIQKMADRVSKLNPNTTECQDLEAAVKNATNTIQNTTIAVFQATLQIKQDILNVELECSKNNNGTIAGIAACIKQNFGTVAKDVQALRVTVKNDLQRIKQLFETVVQDYVQCVKSEYRTTPKPEPTTTPAQTTPSQ